MQIILTKDLVMDNSHSFLLSDLPIPEGEKFTVVVMRDNAVPVQRMMRKVYAHRITVDNIDLPARADFYE